MLFSISGQTQEGEQGYFGFSYAFIDLDAEITSGTTVYEADMSDSSLIGLIAGYHFTPNLGMEARIYATASDGNFAGYTMSVEKYYAAFGRFAIPIQKYFDLYMLVGFGKGEIELLNVSDDDTDLAYGLGIAISKGGPIKLNVEWMSLYDDSDRAGDLGLDLEVSSINLNLIYDF